MREQEQTRFELDGAELAVRLAGDQAAPPLLLIHGFPSSSATFRDVIALLAHDCFVVAPDLPGFGASPPIARPTFARFSELVDGLLARLGVESFFLYLHDYGAPVGLHLAMRAPERVRGLVVQNATAHLTAEGTRDQYLRDVPDDVARRIDLRRWEEDWRVMSRPGRLDTQRARRDRRSSTRGSPRAGRAGVS